MCGVVKNIYISSMLLPNKIEWSGLMFKKSQIPVIFFHINNFNVHILYNKYERVTSVLLFKYKSIT